MPFNNYITEEELKAYLPELSRLLWSDETDYSKQRTEAVKAVMSDLISHGYQPAKLMPELLLREAGNIITLNETGDSKEDKAANRQRFVFDVISIISSDTKTLKLEGSYDNSAWQEIADFTLTAKGRFSKVITQLFKYYRIKAEISGGSLDYRAYMAETTYDRFISSKWLELILLDRYTEENDQYHLKMKYFRSEYEKLWGSISIWSDDNEDGNIQNSESSKTTSIKMLK